MDLNAVRPLSAEAVPEPRRRADWPSHLPALWYEVPYASPDFPGEELVGYLTSAEDAEDGADVMLAVAAPDAAARLRHITELAHRHEPPRWSPDLVIAAAIALTAVPEPADMVRAPWSLDHPSVEELTRAHRGWLDPAATDRERRALFATMAGQAWVLRNFFETARDEGCEVVRR